MYQLILGNIESNNLIPSSKYSVKYVELFFVSINIEIISINIPNISFVTFVLQNLNIIILSKKITAIIFLSDLYKHSSKRTW